ncbi:hypothetical protein B0T25DRAFT_537942 [Lasiosphaeria hispida]|uniref:Uncharacterized protein n=1 Tax=Lasiosphaeria hispida TaxID=260671 RepID=A0AAJ0HLJ7_9PEZI|nr:hypothetical protein B0T25DRAFT_537942 [Lasiosphaeria hispida]
MRLTIERGPGSQATTDVPSHALLRPNLASWLRLKIVATDIIRGFESHTSGATSSPDTSSDNTSAVWSLGSSVRTGGLCRRPGIGFLWVIILDKCKVTICSFDRSSDKGHRRGASCMTLSSESTAKPDWLAYRKCLSPALARHLTKPASSNFLLLWLVYEDRIDISTDHWPLTRGPSSQRPPPLGIHSPASTSLQHHPPIP